MPQYLARLFAYSRYKEFVALRPCAPALVVTAELCVFIHGLILCISHPANLADINVLVIQPYTCREDDVEVDIIIRDLFTQAEDTINCVRRPTGSRGAYQEGCQ